MPKILPIRLPTRDSLAEGGGGTTVLEGSGMVSPASRRVSSGTFPEGGGAITGAGRLIFAVRELIRSGADAGGGTSATFAACTGARELSALATFGAGGITLVARAGAERVLLAATFGAGATT